MSNTPVRTRAEAEERIDATIAAWEVTSQRWLTHDLECIAQRRTPTLMTVPLHQATINLGPLMVSLLGAEVVKAALLRHINEVSFAPEAP
jgi:hypothetical protein